MKRKLIALLAAATAVCACFSATSCGSLETYRMEAEHAKTQYANLDSKDLVSNGYFIYADGAGFKPADKYPMEVKWEFTASKAAEATIVLRVASGNTFGNPFDLTDADYTFSFNGVDLGVPDSVLDYEGNPITSIPKEDFTEGTGFVDFTWTVQLVKGTNVFAHNYTPGNGAFKLDYVDVTTKAVVEFTPDMTLIDNYDPNSFPGFGD